MWSKQLIKNILKTYSKLLLTDDEDDVGSRQNLSKEKCFTVLYEFVFFLLKSFFFVVGTRKEVLLSSLECDALGIK